MHTLTYICTSASGDSSCSIQRELNQQALQQDCCSEVSWATWRLPAQQHSSDSLPAYIEQLVSSRRRIAAWHVQRQAQRLQPACNLRRSISQADAGVLHLNLTHITLLAAMAGLLPKRSCRCTCCSAAPDKLHAAVPMPAQHYLLQPPPSLLLPARRARLHLLR